MSSSNVESAEDAPAAAIDASAGYGDEISHIGDSDEAAVLRGLAENVQDQGDLELAVISHAETSIAAEEDKRDEQRIRRAQDTRRKLEEKMAKTRESINNAGHGRAHGSFRLQNELDSLARRIKVCDEEIEAFRKRVERRHLEPKAMPHGGTRFGGESTREYLIRTGKITPFAKVPGELPVGVAGELAQAIVDAEGDAAAEALEEVRGAEQNSHQNLKKPGFESGLPPSARSEMAGSSTQPRKKRKTSRRPSRRPDSDENFEPDEDAYAPFSLESSPSFPDSDFEEFPRKRKVRKAAASKPTAEVITDIDDGLESIYQARLASWVDRRSRARQQRLLQTGSGSVPTQGEREEEEWFKPHPQHADYVFDNGLKLPGDIHKVLFNYQKTGVHWLCELYEQKVGGILGDEMGLGKTVQAVSFVAALHYSKKLTNPALIVVPATLMRQWVNEFHQWWPALRVSILHSSGSGMVNLEDESRIEDEEAEYDEQDGGGYKVSKAARDVVDRVVKCGHVLVTTYAGLQTYSSILSEVMWNYAILDEGHKIRNPNTTVTITCKQLRTHNRIILSGTPIQNNLTELWSVFDFIYPFRLGTLWNFKEQFEIPIKQGGYANSSSLQIMAAEKCAEVLKEIVSPYLLQRVKTDVAQDLPKKTEQVLFCKFTETQERIYENWLNSEMKDLILQQKMKALVGIDTLRKICNHPDLTRLDKKSSYGSSYGDPELSGKMQVVKGLLAMWKRLGHKCLIFSQGVKILDILEKMVKDSGDTEYLRMDGATPVQNRQKLVDKFNKSPEIDIFLLTTRVGGLGLNLMGASRVILFDPDWNPSTDAQAQERAWRLGQKKDVHIFRLLTAGTIEEKIYQRQIFKTVLTNKVLKDPSQRSHFHIGHLEDLFTLGPSKDGETETGALFKGSERKIEDQPDRRAESSKGSEEDVGQVNGVTGLEEFKDGGGGGKSSKAATQEERLMEGIFSRSGVTSTLKHEHVVNGRVVRAKQSVLQQEASEVASRARKNMKRQEQEAQSVPIGTVTWTGQFGTAGLHPVATNSRQRSSATLHGGGGSGGPGNTTSLPARQAGAMRKRDFVPLITNFIKRYNDRAPSKALVDHFNPLCPSKRQTEMFKSALDDIAVLIKEGTQSSSLRGYWRLRTNADGG